MEQRIDPREVEKVIFTKMGNDLIPLFAVNGSGRDRCALTHFSAANGLFVTISSAIASRHRLRKLASMMFRVVLALNPLVSSRDLKPAKAGNGTLRTSRSSNTGGMYLLK